MSALPTEVMTNDIIASLPLGLRKRFMQSTEPYVMSFGSILCSPGKSYDFAYFPYSGYISLVATLPEHKPLGVGLIGHEGMLGATLLLGITEAPMGAIVRGPGNAVRISVSDLDKLLHVHPELRSIFGKHIHQLTAELAERNACTHFHHIDQRLARLLLLTHDRNQTDCFHITHEFLADMLGVRRSGVSVAAGALQKRNLIRYTRGEITILDRQSLENASCNCYMAHLARYV